MQYSLVHGERVGPTPRAHGFCPACDGPTTAKCGQQVVWHWAHDRGKHCDRWWESETKWHLDWKARFPEQWREVVHKDAAANERHIADIKTARGLVIELQHSPLPAAELKARETFYQRMIWVVDAMPFVKSLRLGKLLPNPDVPFADAILIGLSLRRDTPGKFSRRPREENGPHIVAAQGLDSAACSKQRLYSGEHELKWSRPRKVWLNATQPVFLDLGGDDLLWLRKHPSAFGHSVRLVSRQALIRKNGGDPGPGPYHGTYLGRHFAG